MSKVVANSRVPGELSLKVHVWWLAYPVGYPTDWTHPLCTSNSHPLPLTMVKDAGAVTIAVGALVGALVGAAVGVFVGDDVGVFVGALEGAAVGAGVASHTTSAVAVPAVLTP